MKNYIAASLMKAAKKLQTKNPRARRKGILRLRYKTNMNLKYLEWEEFHEIWNTIG